MQNPQDPEAGITLPSAKDESLYPLRRKPSRTLLLIRYKIDALLQKKDFISNTVIICTTVVLAVFAIHNVFKIYMGSRTWINAPCTYLERSCPAPQYDVLSPEEQDETRICLTTLTDSKSSSLYQRVMRWRNFDAVLELSWDNKLKYAQKHGYSLYDASHLLDTSRPPAWSKIKAVQHQLESGDCDWVMWTDADTVIMNSDKKVEHFLPSDEDINLLVGSDNGGGYNSGVFLFKNTDWSRQFLQKWWDMKAYVNPTGISLSGDNHAMKDLLRDLPEFDKNVASPPRCNLNSFAKFYPVSESLQAAENMEEKDWYMSESYYHKSDLIAHCAGIDNKDNCIRLLLAEAT